LAHVGERQFFGVSDMSWLLEDVEKNLLGQKASVVALPAEVIVEAVNRVEAMLGRDWILAEMKATGIGPAMTVIGMGLRLASLNGLAKTEMLLSNLRLRDQSAKAELTAIYLIRGQDSSVELELEPRSEPAKRISALAKPERALGR